MENISVLIIDDDVSTREHLAKVIQKEGFEVFIAEDGKTGLDIFHKEHPQIIVTDLKMPQMDGLGLMHTIKQLSPEVQIILTTAFW